MTDVWRELALSKTEDRLDAYGESRDSERPEIANLSAWLKKRAMALLHVSLADSDKTEYNSSIMVKSVIRRLVILFCIFVGCLVAFSIQVNRKERTHAASFEGPSLPVVYMNVEGQTVNPMTGYLLELRETSERECLTPLSVDRGINLLIETMDHSIGSMSYQVTSLEDGELLENGELTSFTETGGMLATSFALTTSEIRNGQEYMLRITMNLDDGKTVYYYSRLVQYGAGNIGEYLNFTNEFIDDATNKVTASDLGVYMEPDLTEANWSLAHITITSSTELLSWGGLSPEIIKKMPPTIMEINDINADIRQQYIIRATDSNLNEEYYTVDEYFRVTEYSGQLIVRNYQRDVAQIFDPTLPVIGESMVNLGIQQRDVKYVQNQGATKTAFAVNGDLWTYDAMEDKFTSIFTFRGKALEGDKEVPDLDTRTEFARHGIFLSGISDTGDITFVVYGYMPSGAHEGRTGVSVYRYSGEANRTEEVLFFPLNLSIDLLQRNVSRLSYVSTGNMLYLFLGTQLCRIDLTTGGFQVEQDGIADDAFFVSGSQKQVAWTDTPGGRLADRFTVLNLETGERREITAPSGQKVTGFGFIGEDVCYGLSNEADTYQDSDGTTHGAMYVVRIEGEDTSVRKEYAKEGTYITTAEMVDNSLQMQLAVRTEKGFEPTETDQIRSNELIEKRIEAVPISNTRTEEQMWLTFGDILLRTDPDVMSAIVGDVSEGVETILEWPESDVPQYYIYSYGKLADVETVRNIAIRKAYEAAGTVLDDQQHCVWQRYNWPTTYRIDLNSLSPELLAAGATGDLQAFADALPQGKQLFDMTGVVTTGLFYKLSRGCPVFVKLADGTSYVIVGYTEDDIIYWDAAAGTTAEISRSKADAIYKRGGYTFYSWENIEEEPAEETEQAPAEESGETAAEETPAAPAEGAQEVPAEGTQAAPAEGTQAAPAEGTQAAPAEGAGVQEVPAAPAEGAQEVPAEGTQAAPVEGAGAQEVPAAPVEGDQAALAAEPIAPVAP